MSRSPRRGVGTVLVAVTTLAAAVACVGLLLAWSRSGEPVGRVVRDLAGNAVALDAPDREAARVRRTGERFEAPAQDLSVPLLSAVAVDGVINPPSLTEAFRYREYGDPGRPGSGTVVVAVHSVRGGAGPGNALVAPGAGGDGGPAVRVAVGDPLVVAGVTYRVTGTQVLAKAEVAADASIWRGEDGLVVLTCFPDPAVPLAEQLNLVVRAERG